MRAQKLSQVLALALWVAACHIPGTCKVGSDAGCYGGAVCVGKEGAKEGDNGVCAYEEVPSELVPSEPVTSEPVIEEPVIDGPTLRSFSPLAARFDEELSIEGSHFGADIQDNVVTLNGVPAVVVAAEAEKLTVQVPKNMLCTGLVQVTVGDKTATSPTPFTYVPTATVSTVAGGYNGEYGYADGPGDEALFDDPWGIAVDAEGNLYVADAYNHRIRKVTLPDRMVSRFAGNPQTDSNGGFVGEFAAGTRMNMRFHTPADVAIDATGALYVADSGNHCIRWIDIGLGETGTVAGSCTTPGSNDNNNGTAAYFREPQGIALDAAGNLYVADTGNHCIRKIEWRALRPVTTLAGSCGMDTAGFADNKGTVAQLSSPESLTIDTLGNLYVADTGNQRIRRISPEGEVTTLAGSGAKGFLDGPGEFAQFCQPNGILKDNRTGNLYVADGENHRIRMLTSEGLVVTLAGSGGACGEGGGTQNGIGTIARFNRPRGITIDSEGNLYVADIDNDRIRKITLE